MCILPTFWRERGISGVVRIGSIIIFLLNRLWKAKFSILSDVMFLVRLQGKFKIDHFWEWTTLKRTPQLFFLLLLLFFCVCTITVCLISCLDFFSCYQNKELLMQGRPSGQGKFFFRQDSVTRSSKPDRPLKYKPRYVKTRKPPPTFESGLWCTGAYYKGRGVAWGAVGARKNEAMQGTGTRIYCGCSIALLTGGGGGTVFLPSPFSPPPPPPFILPPNFSCAPWSGPSEDVVCPCSSISICSHV